MQTRPVHPQDHDKWLRMRKALWPACPDETLRAEMASILADDSQVARVAVCDDGGLGGFAEVSIHPHAFGCETHPVGYLEGWWVDPDLRQTGVGRQLVAAAEEWARGKGCHEMASDSETDNQVSIAAHAALEFQQTGRLVHFKKRLD